MKYIALTIGPIYKTLKNAKKPKDLFASSYVFSYIMREIILAFKERNFITPYIKDATVFDKNSKVGLFHDRFIFESLEGDLATLSSTIQAVCEEVADQLSISVSQVKEYLQFNYFEKELDDNDNPLIVLSPYLDTKELFYQVCQDETFPKSLRRKKGDKDNFLTDGKSIEDDLKKLCFNNYYCVVHADGDHMSKAIQDKSKIESVSKSLFEYCNNSYKLIQTFGGQTIFAGGDDLLFFAPVLNTKKNQTIFELCDEIAAIFTTKIPSATLSFGISINYVKFPLYEAVENSRTLLFGQAKNTQRNNLVFNVTKHSGQSFSTLIHKGNEALYKTFLAFSSNIKGGDGKENFLHSIHHKIDTYKKTINTIGANRDKLQNFFDNYFNEASHNEYKDFFTALIDFMVVVYQDESIKNENKLDLIYATLRFVKFVQGDKK